MPEGPYIIGVLVTIFAITFGLRAVPFAVLRPLRESRFVAAMAAWMPAGILVVLAVTTFRSSAAVDVPRLLAGLIAVAVTAVVHLVSRRRTLLSVGAGTATFVALVNVAGMA